MEEKSTGFALLRSRYGAFVIDAMLFLVLWFMGALAAGSIGLEFNRWNAIALLAAYFGLFPATPLQGTPGKRACSIRITDMNGKPLGMARSIARFVASVPSIGLFGAGFLFAAFTRRRQALHDLIAGTLVVTIGSAVEGDAPPLSWPARVAAGLVVVSSGLLVYLEMRMYEAVTMREGVNEMLQDLSAYRVEVEDALVHHAPIPAPPKARGYTKSMKAGADGTIVLETLDQVAPGGRYVFKPTLGGGHVVWKCEVTNIPQRYLHYSCRAAQ